MPVRGIGCTLILLLAASASAQPLPYTLSPHRVGAPPPEEREPYLLPPYRVPAEEPSRLEDRDSEEADDSRPQIGKPTLFDILTSLSALTVGGKPGISASWYPSVPVEGQLTDFGINRTHSELGLPLYRQKDELLLGSFGLRYASTNTGAVLPNSLNPFPGELWIVNFGLSYFQKLDNGWAAGLLGNFGSASDQPFHSTRELTLSAAGVLRIPAERERDAWLLGLYYSPVGEVNFPVPALAYDWTVSPSLRLLVGLPAGLTWTPTLDTTLILFYLPLLNISARITHRLTEKIAISGGYTYYTEAYFLEGRPDTRQRFFGFEQRLSAGLRYEVGPRVALEGFGGYAFGRHFGSGQSQVSSLTDRVDIANGGFFGVAIRLRY